MDNGPAREKDVDLPDHVVYCVDCGNIFVFHPKRDCPTCHLAERLDGDDDD